MNRAALALARAGGRDRTAVQLNQVLDDRKPQAKPRGDGWMMSQPGETARRGAEELRAIARTGVGHVDLHQGLDAFKTISTRPPLGVNLVALDSRFQTTC